MMQMERQQHLFMGSVVCSNETSQEPPVDVASLKSVQASAPWNGVGKGRVCIFQLSYIPSERANSGERGDNLFKVGF
jgi:hypothetical protein